MSNNRVFPPGGDGFWWMPTIFGALIMALCFSSGFPVAILGLIFGLPLFAWGLCKLCDFDDRRYRD